MLKKIFLSLILASQAHAADLRILSYNVYMLPKPLKNSSQGTRAKVIAHQFKGSDYDLMFFQEAFTDGIRKELKKALGTEFPHTFYLKSDGKLKHIFGSGVFIMSRYPFEVLEKVYFKKCGSADCYAAKGTALIQTRLPSGKFVQFAPTHLQAKEELGAIRVSQLEQIKDVFAKHAKVGVPQILVGDLNTDVVEPEFEQGLGLMNMTPVKLVGPIQFTNGIGDCFKKTSGKAKEWIDHIWINNSSYSARSFMEVKVMEFEQEGKTCSLSDHHALEAEIFFK